MNASIGLASAWVFVAPLLRLGNEDGWLPLRLHPLLDRALGWSGLAAIFWLVAAYAILTGG